VKTSNAGTLNMGSGLPKMSAPKSERDSWTRLVVEDARGRMSVLYLAKSDQVIGIRELPPVPPIGIFDVRYASSSYVEDISAYRHELQLNSASYPVTVRVENCHGDVFRIKDATGGGRVSSTLGEGSAVVIPSGVTWLLVEPMSLVAEVPNAYFLSQNYPNPFNPVTVIEYGVPSLSDVRLSVYNLLGEEVSVLVQEVKQPGRYRIDFDGANLASGTYLYRIQAGSYFEVKKLVLLK